MDARFFGELGEIRRVMRVRMADYTSFKTGGVAAAMLEPANAEELLRILDAARQYGIETHVIGNCTNLLVSDADMDLVFIRIGEAMGGFEVQGMELRAGAGASLSTVARLSVKENLAGLEWAAGIPGTVGGAVAMNAGAYDGDMRGVLTSVNYIENGACCALAPSEEEMGYRRSAFSAPGRIVTEVRMRLERDDGGAKERMEHYNALRREKQPLTLPSAGSTFKRPAGHYAGALIEGAGLKGLRVGGAAVSEKHAGFIVNLGGASSMDIYRLIRLVQRRVLEHSGVVLETEVKMIGRFTEEEEGCISL